MSSNAWLSERVSSLSIHLVPRSMYGMLGLLCTKTGSVGETPPLSEDAAVGGLANGRPAKRTLAEEFESLRRCESCCCCIAGMLLLVGSGGLSSEVVAVRFASVSVRLNSLVGGAGLEPVGLDSLFRRPLRYSAALNVSLCKGCGELFAAFTNLSAPPTYTLAKALAVLCSSALLRLLRYLME